MEDPRETWSLEKNPMEFLSRSWSSSVFEVSKTVAPPPPPLPPMAEEESSELVAPPPPPPPMAGNSFSFASSAMSQFVLERIMSQSDVSPLTSGRRSHSSGPLNGGGSLSDSPSVSPSQIDDIKYINSGNYTTALPYRGSSSCKTVGRWLKDRREKKKEETRAHNAQLHAAISVAGVAATVAAIASATAAGGGSSGKDDHASRVNTAVASAATLVAAQCVRAAESMGAGREQLAAVIGSAVNVKNPSDIVTITAAAATALRGAATLKARALREVWNLAAVIPVEKGGQANYQNTLMSKQQNEVDKTGNSYSDEGLNEGDNFLGVCSMLARGTELLKRTRKGVLHWKMVSVYINQMGQVILKTMSSHVAGTIIKKKKSVVIEVCKDVPAWPGRNLLEAMERRRYFGLRIAEGRVIEFECRNQREYELWTQGVICLLKLSGERKHIA